MEVVAEAVVSFTVEKIGDLIIQEAKFLSDVSVKVEQLGNNLNSMRCFLRRAESKQGDDRVSVIRDIAYDAEDVLEIYVLKAASASNCFGNNPCFLHNIGSKIDVLNSRLDGLTKTIPADMLKDLPTGTDQGPSSQESNVEIRRTTSQQIVQNFVDSRNDKTSLLTQLVQPDIRVVSICGIGGLGKTTLAREVYRQCKDKKLFDRFLWYYVSKQWEKRKIWETFLEKLISSGESANEEIQKGIKKIKEMKDDDVAQQLQKELGKSKCLVVLDDIWDNAWDVLKAGFLTEESESKYIITTRNKTLVPSEDHNGYIHEPGCLNSEDSWELLKKIAIPKKYAGSRLDEHMEELGKDMARHCKGLPLAIVVLGGLLSKNLTFDGWSTIHQSVRSYLVGEKAGLMQLFALSYDDLPYELKPCFLYLGVLPEEFEIARDRLINLWVAEGIVYHIYPRFDGREGEEDLEDIAYRYLTELVERYMIQVESRDSSRRIKKCRMHDLMREFCLSKALTENFFQIVLPSSGRKSSLNVSEFERGRVRRLCLHLNKFNGKTNVKCGKYPPCRSVLGFSLDRRSGINQTLMNDMARRFKLLRVLDLEKVMGFAIPKKIGMLAHLRLLNLRSCWIGNLCPSIGDLCYLLTLRLDPLYSARTIPDVLWKLTRLRHLYLPCYPGSKTKQLRFADLKDLRTLVNFPTSHAEVEDLIQLTNLRKLKLIISDQNSLEKFNAIFAIPDTEFRYLRHFSINGLKSFRRLTVPDVDVSNITSRCPSLLRLKIDDVVAFQRKIDVFDHDED